MIWTVLFLGPPALVGLSWVLSAFWGLSANGDMHPVARRLHRWGWWGIELWMVVGIVAFAFVEGPGNR